MATKYEPIQAKIYNCISVLKMTRANELEVLNDTLKYMEKNHVLRKALQTYKDKRLRAYRELMNARPKQEYTEKGNHTHIWLHDLTDLTYALRKTVTYKCPECGMMKQVVTWDSGKKEIKYCGWEGFE